MADLYSGDYEVKDEELVDFEGSDYGFESDEELGVEEEVALSISIDEEGPGVGFAFLDEDPEAKRVEQQSTPPEAAATVALVPKKKDGAESGEIDEREEKEDGVVAQSVPSLSSVSYREGYHREGRIGESRGRHRKADLEDGELDDAAMPEGSDNEAEGNADDDDEDERDRRERKRRKDRFAAERRLEDLDSKERESGVATAGPPRQYRNRGSDRRVDRTGGLSKAGITGGRGMMQMGGFGHPSNMAPGIMGPGRPPMPLDMGPAIPLRPVGRGFMGSLGGMPLPGGVGMSQFQEAMVVHEHMMRHRMIQQFAQVNAATGPGRPPLVGPVGPPPLGAPGMRPMMGIDFGPALPRGMMHLQAQGPDMASQMNFAGPIDNYPRSPRSSYTGRGGGMFGDASGRIGLAPRNGMVREGSWPPVSLQSTDGHSMGRGRGQGRGQVNPPAWVDSQGLGIVRPHSSQVGVAQSGGLGQNVSMGHAMGPSMMGAGAAKISQGQHATISQGNQSRRELISNGRKAERDRTLKGDQVTRNGGARSNSNNSPESGSRGKRDREHGRDKPSNPNPNSANGTTLVAHGVEGNGGSAIASNLIQLGGPVQKSRLLTVSGLPENTSMSAVVEAFEKQGKVTDFKKEERGDAYTITFASVSEAISAKRHLHRSIIAGHQITVEYAVHRPNLQV